MPRLSCPVPKYRKHRASGQAIVTIAGRDHYLGPHGTKASRLEYDRLIAEWLAEGRPSHCGSMEQDISINELVLAFWKFAQKHYRTDGQPTGTADSYKPVLSLLRRYHGSKSVIEFGPKALKGLRQIMIREGNCRRHVNDKVSRIKRLFKWAASEQLLPLSAYQALQTVEQLPKGRSDARETEPVQPVADITVDLTLPHMPPIVPDMVRFQRLTGARPGEVCIIRPCDVDRTAEVWRYVPKSHKNKHRGKARAIFIGPKAQEVLRPYLARKSGLLRRTTGPTMMSDTHARRQIPGTAQAACRPERIDGGRRGRGDAADTSLRQRVSATVPVQTGKGIGLTYFEPIRRRAKSGDATMVFSSRLPSRRHAT